MSANIKKMTTSTGQKKGAIVGENIEQVLLE
jgi:hypothetical protein